MNNSYEGVKEMKKLKRLTREQKKFLLEQGLNPVEFLVERVTTEEYVFFNKHTEVLWNFRR